MHTGKTANLLRAPVFYQGKVVVNIANPLYFVSNLGSSFAYLFGMLDKYTPPHP